jgi:hypothetical protein
MKIIRETDPEHWDKLEAAGDLPEVDITSELPSRIAYQFLVLDVCLLLIRDRISTNGAWQSN